MSEKTLGPEEENKHNHNKTQHLGNVSQKGVAKAFHKS
jgi:hypothetical protein